MRQILEITKDRVSCVKVISKQKEWIIAPYASSRLVDWSCNRDVGSVGIGKREHVHKISNVKKTLPKNSYVVRFGAFIDLEQGRCNLELCGKRGSSKLAI